MTISKHMLAIPLVVQVLLLAVVPSTAFLSLPQRLSQRYSGQVCYSAANSLESIKVEPIDTISGEFVLPGSKSLSNRALLLAAMATGTTEVQNLLDSEDIHVMLDALETLGIQIDRDLEKKVAVVHGMGGPLNAPPGQDPVNLDLKLAGTAMRPLAAVLTAGKGNFVLDGTARMRERPIGDLTDALVTLGVDVDCSETRCPPVNIRANGLKGGKTEVSGKMSSQFLSALLMMAPLAEGDVEIVIKDELVSAPYVHLTIGLMKKFGIQVDTDGKDKSFLIRGGQQYTSPPSGRYFVEGDASSASYFLGGAAITGGPVTVVGCGDESVQGDIAFAATLGKMGATVEWTENSITVSRPADKRLVGVDVDANTFPDAAMTLATVALFCEGPTTIRGVYNWRIKETERMRAIVDELTKLGVKTEEGRDYLVVHPPEKLEDINDNVSIETYDDHRIAMLFSLVACATPKNFPGEDRGASSGSGDGGGGGGGGVSVTILDPGCTKKTFPTYFDDLQIMAQPK